MGRLVIICVALFVVAAALVILNQSQDLVALYNAYLAQPLLNQIIWAVVLLVPFVLLPSTVLMWDGLSRHRKTSDALKQRLEGVRQDAQDLTKAQTDVDASLRHLTRTDPEEVLGAAQHRLVEAERMAQVQHGRSENPDLQSRVDDIRKQQQALKDRLAPVLERRRSIEQLFAELDSRQHDIDRSLAEIFHGDDATAVDLHLKNLADFVKRGQGRCDDIERASKTLIGLKDDLTGIDARIAPFADKEGGLQSRLRDMADARDKLAAGLDALQQTPEGPLAERVQKFAGDKKQFEDGLAHIDTQFSKLISLRQDVGALFANFHRSLDSLQVAKTNGGGAAEVDTRVDELRQFIDATQARFDDMERRLVTFGQLRTKLDELQTRLAPLEADPGGVISIINELKQVRDSVIAKIRSLEESDEGDLTERVKKLADAKRELEERVHALSEQCIRLATLRKDITGLFDKLSHAVSTAAAN
jgi:chromosome segregation ATPase